MIEPGDTPRIPIMERKRWTYTNDSEGFTYDTIDPELNVWAKQAGKQVTREVAEPKTPAAKQAAPVQPVATELEISQHEQAETLPVPLPFPLSPQPGSLTAPTPPLSVAAQQTTPVVPGLPLSPGSAFHTRKSKEQAERQRTLSIFGEADRQLAASRREEAKRRRELTRLAEERELEEMAAIQHRAEVEQDMAEWVAEMEAGPSDSYLAAQEVEVPIAAATEESEESIVMETQAAESEESSQPHTPRQRAMMPALRFTAVPPPAPSVRQQAQPTTPVRQPPPKFTVQLAQEAISQTATSPVSKVTRSWMSQTLLAPVSHVTRSWQSPSQPTSQSKLEKVDAMKATLTERWKNGQLGGQLLRGELPVKIRKMIPVGREEDKSELLTWIRAIIDGSGSTRI